MRSGARRIGCFPARKTNPGRRFGPSPRALPRGGECACRRCHVAGRDGVWVAMIDIPPTSRDNRLVMRNPPVQAISTTKPPCRREDAVLVLRRLREQGHVAYFAGGCVRDLVMGHEPKDWDVATDAPPERVRGLFKNTQAVGAAFGVILVHLGPSTIEVATFRTEGTYTDGRRPDSVRFATASEDAQRRDFTINGLFLDPEEMAESDEATERRSDEGRRSPECA